MENRLKPGKHFLQPETILLIFGLLVGVLFCVFIPYGAGFDEETHLVRIFDISGLHIVPNRGIENGNYTLSEFYTLSYQRRDFQSPAFDQFEARNFLTKANWQSMSDGTTRSTYFPANYLLQAVVAGLFWRVFDFSILPVVIFMRLTGFAFYLLACYLTLRMLPTGKWVFLVIAFTPMALFQSTTLTPDCFTLACSYLFIGAVLKDFSESKEKSLLPMPWKIVFFSLLVGCAKPGTILLLLLLLILVGRKFKSKKALFILLAGVVFSLAISIGWMLFGVVHAAIWTGQKTISSQLSLVMANFFDFLKIYFNGIALSLGKYYFGWVGVYGYWVGKVPALVYILFPVALCLAFLCEGKNNLFSRRYRLFILMIALVCLGGIASFQYVASYSPGVQSTDSVGRYFLPFSSLLFIPFTGWLDIKGQRKKIWQFLTIGFIVTTVGVYGYGIFRTYYTKCVYAVSATQPCTMPVYKNVDLATPYVAHVKAQTVVNQSFVPQCSELSSVKVRVETADGSSQDKLVFSVLRSDLKVISTQEFLISNMHKNDVIEMPVKVKVSASQPILWLQLALDSKDTQNADVGLLGRSGGEKYPDGNLLFNQQLQDADLYFQYSCAAQ